MLFGNRTVRKAIKYWWYLVILTNVPIQMMEQRERERDKKRERDKRWVIWEINSGGNIKTGRVRYELPVCPFEILWFNHFFPYSFCRTLTHRLRPQPMSFLANRPFGWTVGRSGQPQQINTKKLAKIQEPLVQNLFNLYTMITSTDINYATKYYMYLTYTLCIY